MKQHRKAVIVAIPVIIVLILALAILIAVMGSQQAKAEPLSEY